tara:strand:+ start:389 stop:1159 length:771 start_codon:yes stop_codon:yes gene_type:complete
MAWLRSVLLVSFLLGHGASAFFSMEDPRGFLWYKDKIKIRKNSSLKKRAREKHEALKEEFEEALHEALDNPTLENVKRAQALQKQILDKSEGFSKAWMVATLDFNGIHDPSLSANPLYLKLKAQEKEERRQILFAELSKSYGVFYVFDENCPYCHSFFPIVQKFCKTYEFDMIAISIQGAKLPVEAYATGSKITFLKDNGIIKRLNTKGIFPAVFLVHFKTQDVRPISWGMSTLGELEDNLERTVRFHQKIQEDTK